MTRPPRIRVAFCIDAFGVGGSELNALRTAEAIDPHRFELRVFHLQSEGPLYSRYQALGVPMTHVPISSLKSVHTMRQAFKFAQHLSAWEADVLHAHDVYTNIFSAQSVPWTWLRGRCHLIASRRWWHYTPRPGLPLLNRLSYRIAHRVLANSESVATMLQQDDNVPARKIVVIRNFLDDTAFATPSDLDIRQRRESWGVPADAFVIGIIGRLHAVKNHAMLLYALAQSRQDCHAVLVGDGPTRDDLQRLAAELGIADRVHFLGETLEGHLHHHFDISVLASTSEGSPNSIIEALAAARPVVATAVGGVADIIDHERTGLLIPSGDIPALSVAIKRLRADACLRERIGAAGLEIVRQRHCRATVMAELSALYASLARRAPEAL